MTNNDFLRRLRYALNIKDNIMIQIFKKGNITVTREDVIDYLKRDTDDGFKKLSNNDFLRRLRYALNIKDNVMVQIFKKGNITVTREDVLDYLKKDIDEGFKKLSNNDLISFLDGLIIQKRGKREDGTPPPKIKITKNNLNNILLRKLRIALAFKSYDMIRIFKLGGIEISEGELSALFRSEDHKNYKECGDKYIRVFLKGLIEYCRN